MDSLDTGRRRKKKGRATNSPASRERILFPVLAGVALVWLLLVLISFFFRISSSAGMTALGFGVAVCIVSWIWLAIVAAANGVPWWYFLPRFRRYRMQAIIEFVRRNPRRAGTPFWLTMLGGSLFFLTFAIFLIRQSMGID